MKIGDITLRQLSKFECGECKICQFAQICNEIHSSGILYATETFADILDTEASNEEKVRTGQQLGFYQG